MTQGSSPRGTRELFIGRQPILDREQASIGFELQFRDVPADGANTTSATAEMVCRAFAQLGLSDAFGSALTFIRVDEEFLAADFVEFLPAATVVLELAHRDLPSPDLIERCRALKALGYRFCLTGIAEIDQDHLPLVEVSEWIKIDIEAVSAADLQRVTRALGTLRRKLIAAGVATHAQAEVCMLLGFDLFQGNYFAEPRLVEGRKLDASIEGLLRISRLLAEEADLASIDAAFRSEPALVINLLRLANSVGAGMRTRVTSIRNAIVAVGTKQLQRWLQLLIFAQGNRLDFARNPLLLLAALRGRFMEQLAERCHPEVRRLKDPAFLTGLMSVVPAALGMSMTDVLSHVALDQESRLALSHRQGVLGSLLELLERYDANDLPGLEESLKAHGSRLTLSMLGEILADSVRWVQELGTEAG